MILDRVIGPSMQPTGNLSPFVAELHMALENDPVLVVGPSFRFVDLRIQMIVPAFTALLPCSTL
jgi:hypothetical protein